MSKARPKHSILNFVDTETLRANVEETTLEELRYEALKNRGEAGSVTETRAARSRRLTIIQQMGYDIKHIDDFEPHPQNNFSIDPEEIENLAATLRESGRTSPIIYRTRPGQKDQIIGGERRWRAHRRNWELTGDEGWAMIPCQNLGQIDEDEALYQLVLDNISNRILKPSELAWSIDIAGERLAKQRIEDPEFREKNEGKKTREIVAELFDVSSTTVARMQSINRNLSNEGKALLDQKKITQKQALEVSKLSEEKQKVITEKIAGELSDEDEIANCIVEAQQEDDAEQKSVQKKKKTVNELLENAQKSLKKAVKLQGEPDKIMIAQMKVYLMELEEKVRETEGE